MYLKGKNAVFQICFPSIGMSMLAKVYYNNLHNLIEVLIWFRFLLGILPHACRKRTPRVPVSYSYRRDDTESFVPPTKRIKKSEVDDKDDEHVAALTLTGTLQKGGSPCASRSPYKITECRRSSPVRSYDRMVYYLCFKVITSFLLSCPICAIIFMFIFSIDMQSVATIRGK